MPNGRAEPTALPRPLPDRVAFGPYCLEAARRKLRRGNELVAVAPKGFDLLVLLVEADGHVVEKAELMRRLWPDTFVSDESLTQCVSALRRALGDDKAHPQFISTVPKRGYRFIGTRIDDPAIAAAPPDAVALRPVRIHAAGPVSRTPARARRRPLLAAAAAMAVAGMLGAGAARFVSRPAPAVAGSLMRFVEVTPAGNAAASGGALSPDGRQIAYLARDLSSRQTSVWLRSLTGTAAHVLPGTTGASRPFWSPDSGRLGFFAEGKLRTLDLDTNRVTTLATVGPMPVGGSWSTRGVIIFADRRSNLFAVPDVGGTPYPVTTLNRSEQESAHRYPYFLPDGDHFLYYANSADPNRAGTFLSSLSGAEPRRLLDASSGGTVYAEPGYLVHVRDGQVVADPFEIRAGRVAGSPVSLASNVKRPLVTNEAFISVSSTGVIAYGGGQTAQALVWYDTAGRRVATVTAPTELHNPVLSPDGRTVFASSIEAERRGIWSVAGGAADWMIREGISPVMSADGRQAYFTSNRVTGIQDIYRRPSGGTNDTLVFRSTEPKAITDLTNDGRYLVFTSSNPQTKEDIWVLPLAGAGGATPLLRTGYSEMQGEVSPDGRWVAYASDESGRWEVYVQRFPGSGWKRAISTSGGAEPHWQQDGRRLFYLSTDQRLMAVDITSAATMAMSRPRPLFVAPLSTDLPTIFRNQYAVAADGTRFLIDVVEGPAEPITVLVNWRAIVQPPSGVVARQWP